MRTNVELDENLLQQVLALGRFSTNKAAIQDALAGYLNTLKRQRLFALRGHVPWRGDLNALRGERSHASSTGAG